MGVGELFLNVQDEPTFYDAGTEHLRLVCYSPENYFRWPCSGLEYQDTSLSVMLPVAIPSSSCLLIV